MPADSGAVTVRLRVLLDGDEDYDINVRALIDDPVRYIYLFNQTVLQDIRVALMTKPSIPRWLSVLASLLAVSFGSGCYTYTPVLNTPPVGSDVRATVTDEEALRLSDLTGQLTRDPGRTPDGGNR